MALARTTFAFIGTSESSLQSIAAAAAGTSSGTGGQGAEVDVLGDNASLGEVELYLVLTAGGSVAATRGLYVRVNKRRLTGEVYIVNSAVFPIAVTGPGASTTVKYYLGRFAASRFMSVDVQNLDASNAVSVFVGGELFKIS